MKKFIKIYNEIMSSMGVVCLLGFIISVLVQVFSRTFLPKTPPWTEEAARYLFIYMVAFGCSVAVHKKEFVGVDLFTGFLPEKLKAVFPKIINLLLLVFCFFVLTQSVLSFALIKYRMVSTAMQIPMQYVYFAMILLFGMLILSYLLEIVYSFMYKEDEKEEVMD